MDVTHVLQQIVQQNEENIKSVEVEKHLELEFDLGNLLATDKNDLDLPALRNDKDEYLKALSRDNAQLLINQIWKLPTEQVEEVLVAKLPAPITRLPREKPVPKPKPPTKWELYAKEKGIVKKKKDSKVWDEELNRWVPRFGFKKAQADKEKNWVVPLPGNATNVKEDQIAKKQEAKAERVAKNEYKRLKNLARNGKHKAGKVELAPTDRPTLEQLNKAVYVAHTATASAGKFQPNLDNQKPVLKSGLKRKFQPTFGDMNNEKKRNLEIFEKVQSHAPVLDIEKAVNKSMHREQVERSQEKKEGGQKGKGGKGKKGGRPKSKGFTPAKGKGGKGGAKAGPGRGKAAARGGKGGKGRGGKR